MLKSVLKGIHTLQLLRNTNLQLLCFSSLIMIMGTSLIYPVLPVIHESLGIPEAQIGLVISAFAFPAIFIAPLVGFIADLRGRKVILGIGLLLYGLAGLSISLVHDFTWLLVLRAIQGVGYGTMSLVVILIGDSYVKEQGTAAQGMKVFVDRIGMLFFPPWLAYWGRWLGRHPLSYMGWLYPWRYVFSDGSPSRTLPDIRGSYLI